MEYANTMDYCLLLIYVDDIIVAAKEEREIRQIERQISSIFDMRNIGDIKFYLGIQITRADDGIFSINQEKYINKVVHDSGMEDSKISNIPISFGYEKLQGEDNDILPTNEMYQKWIGSLLYIALNTRPDIAVGVNLLSQKVSKPTNNDWTELKRVIKYLKGTAKYKLAMAIHTSDHELSGYADANWAESTINRRSNSGYLFKLNGGVISWSSRKQKCVALSSTEAELIALTEASKEGIWIRRLLNEIDRIVCDPMTIYEDNQSCLKLIENNNASNRSKHIDTKYFFIKDLIKQNIISYKYCSTENMIADILTKPLSKIKFAKLRSLLGMNN